jgi:ADP-heptose:LPS heptosyltransferase
MVLNLFFIHFKVIQSYFNHTSGQMQVSTGKPKYELNFSSMKKVLIIRLGKIGDIVTTSFVFEIIKSNYPKTDIYLLTLKSNKAVLDYNPHLKKVFYSRNNMMLFWNLLKLKFYSIDLVLDFNDNPSTTTSLIFRFLRAKYKAGYNYQKYENIINIKVDPLRKDETHIIDRMKDFLIKIGIPVNDNKVKPYFYLNPFIDSKVIKKSSSNEKLIGINLSAGAKIRYWNKEKWIKLLNRILLEYPSCNLMLLSLDKDKLLREEILSKLIRSINFNPNGMSIQQFAAYIKKSSILITPDTSAVHIASAFGIPTIAMYPNYSSNFISWQPYKNKHRSIKSLDESIEQISVEEVFDAFRSLAKEINL